MNPCLLASTLLMAATLAVGCAAPAAAPAGQPDSQVANAVKPPAQTPITGSRLSRNSSDRLVRATDNATFRAGTEIRSLGNDIARPTN